jgi:hypothetical protein
MNADLKPLLIDLEANSKATGRKQEKSVQRERLSEGDQMFGNTFDMRQSSAR